MATSYPSGLDNFNNPTSTSKLGDSGVIHHQQHANANDAIEAMQAKLGTDNSSVVTSIDYRVRYLENNPTLPSQNGNSGKFLTTDGSTASWAVISSGGTSLPTYEAGKYLTNNGTTLSWATIDLSTKLNTSDFTYSTISIPVYSAVGDLPSAADNHGRWAHVHGEGAMYYAHAGSWIKSAVYPSLSGQSGKFLTTDGTTVSWATVSGGGATVSSTDQLPEGTSNLYFTNERAQDAIDTLFANGNHTGITVTYSDVNNSISLASTGSVSAATTQSAGIILGLTTGDQNSGITLLGAKAGGSNISSTNTAIGNATLFRIPANGQGNTAVGYRSMLGVSGDNSINNTALGNQALYCAPLTSSTISNNTAIGSSSLYYITSGIDNTAVGAGSGFSLTSGSNNIIIGKESEASSPTASNEITLGNSSISKFRIPGLGIDWTSSTVPGVTLTGQQTLTNKTLSAPISLYNIKSVTTNGYQFVPEDAASILTVSFSSLGVVYVGSNTSDFAIGSTISIVQYGAGQVRIEASVPGTTSIYSTGLTSNQPKTRASFSVITLIKVASQQWLATGDLV